MKYKNLMTVLHDRSITPYRLAKDCHISTSDIYQVLSGKKPMFPKWRRAISEYLNVNENALFGEVV